MSHCYTVHHWLIRCGWCICTYTTKNRELINKAKRYNYVCTTTDILPISTIHNSIMASVRDNDAMAALWTLFPLDVVCSIPTPLKIIEWSSHSHCTYVQCACRVAVLYVHSMELLVLVLIAEHATVACWRSTSATGACWTFQHSLKVAHDTA